MSNPLAVAAVTATIRYLMERAVDEPGPGPVSAPVVTTLRPDHIARAQPGDSPKGINIYLYQVTPNHAWNLADLPTRDSDGSLVRRPSAALDLHYLISCYGDDAALEAQRLLGRAVLALAVTPMLSPQVVTEAMARFEDDPSELRLLAEADLAKQAELVKLAPAVLSLEEMSRLWGVLGAPYVLSVVYTATVVLLEARLTPRPPLPVRHPLVGVVPQQAPRIDRVETVPPHQPVVTGTRLALVGAALIAGHGGRDRVARVGGTDLRPEAGSTPQRLEVVLSPEVPAGVQALQVIERASADDQGRITTRSNAVPVVVRPGVQVVGPATGTVPLRLTPPPRAGQDVVVVLDRLDPGAGAPAWEFPVSAAGTADVEIDRTGVPAGRWRVQVRVDGVDSLPELDGDAYLGPSLVLT